MSFKFKSFEWFRTRTRFETDAKVTLKWPIYIYYFQVTTNDSISKFQYNSLHAVLSGFSFLSLQ